MRKHVLVIGDQIGSTAAGWYRDDVTGEARYRVQSGDTLGDLASKYLGSWGRYMEIWNAQPAARRANGNPNLIYAGETLLMPAQAVAQAVALGYLAGAAPTPPPYAGPPIAPTPRAPAAPVVPFNPDPVPVTAPTSDGPSVGLYVGAGAVAVGGLLFLRWYRQKHKPAAAKLAKRSSTTPKRYRLASAR